MILAISFDAKKGTKVDDNEEDAEITHKLKKKKLMELGETLISLDIFKPFWNSSHWYDPYLWSPYLLSWVFWHKKVCGL